MPLTRKGEKMLRKFKREYGDKGEEVFYSYMNKYPSRTRNWHKK